jgi:hypothetical protein
MARSVWAVGDRATLLRFDGLRWLTEQDASTAPPGTIWRRTVDDIWMSFARRVLCPPDKQGRKTAQVGHLLIRRAATQEVWVLDDSMAVLQLGHPPPTSMNAINMHYSEVSPWSTGHGYTDAWMSDPKDIWAVSHRGSLHHFDGRSWTSVKRTWDDRAFLQWIGGRDANDVWMLDRGRVPWHWDGQAWQRLETLRNQPQLWRRFYEVQAFGNRPLRFNPNIWLGFVDRDRANWKLWGSGPSDVWRIESADELSHFDGEDWRVVMSSGTKQLTAIWGSAANDVWIVGPNGFLSHFDGTLWKEQIAPSAETAFTSIWGSSSTDIWAVGNRGQIIHYDGKGWRSVESGTQKNLNHVWGLSSGAVWAVGDHGTMLHFNGTAWSSEQSGAITSLNLIGLWGSSPHDLWIIGDRDVLIRYQRE